MAQADLTHVLNVVPAESLEAQRAHRLLGEIYQDQGDLPEAILHFESALRGGGDPREKTLVHRKLARIELRIMFERLYARLPDLALASTEPLPRRPSNFISGFEAMPVRFTPTARMGASTATVR